MFVEELVVVVAATDWANEVAEELELELVLLVEVVAKSKVVESTANSVGDPTKSKLTDEALEAGPEPFELAVEEMEVAKILFAFVV